MKRKKTNQKLVLNKLTLVNLNREELTRIRGGSLRDSCTSDYDIPDSYAPKVCDNGNITGSVCL